MSKMKVERDAGKDTAGYKLAELKCNVCGSKKIVRRCDIKRRDTCVHCRKMERLAGLKRVRRPNHNVSPGGNVIGGLNRHQPVNLYLCQTNDGRLSVKCSNTTSGLRAGIESRCVWGFDDGRVALVVLDAVGRNPQGDFLAVAAQIEALITLLKGE